MSIPKKRKTTRKTIARKTRKVTSSFPFDEIFRIVVVPREPTIRIASVPDEACFPMVNLFELRPPKRTWA